MNPFDRARALMHADPSRGETANWQAGGDGPPKAIQIVSDFSNDLRSGSRTAQMLVTTPRLGAEGIAKRDRLTWGDRVCQVADVEVIDPWTLRLILTLA